jgi:predicted anti-sigma-YlaC factor YlaD
MLKLVPPTDCAQAREAVSARLDDELSELEAAGLDAHLCTCSECRSHAHELEAMTSELRAAALMRPELSFVLPPRRRMPIRAVAGVAAAVVLLTSSSLSLGRVFSGHAAGRTGAGAAQLVWVPSQAIHESFLANLRSFEQAPAARHGRLLTM